MTRSPLSLVSLLVCALALFATGCSGGDEKTGAADAETTVKATVPSGWKTATLAGLRVAYPPDFEPIQTSGGLTPTQQFGIPYTGQPYPPPLLQVFVERNRVGSLDARVPLTKAQIEAELGIKIGDTEPAEVAGATEAAMFSYEYRTQGGQTTTGDTLEPTSIHQVDLLIDAPGMPKYGLRFAAPADQYDQATWQQIVKAVQVQPRGAGDDSG